MNIRTGDYEYRIGKSVPDYDICNGRAYGSHYGLTDLYSDFEDNLRTLLESEEDFHTSWGAKKEIWYASVMRAEGKLHLSARAEIDDLWKSEDIIYNALAEVTDSECEELDDETIEWIRDAAYECGCDDQATVEIEIDDTADYDLVMKHLDNLIDRANEETDRMYKMLCEIVKEATSRGKSK